MLLNLLRERVYECPMSQRAGGQASCPQPTISADTVPAAEDKDLTLDTGCNRNATLSNQYLNNLSLSNKPEQMWKDLPGSLLVPVIMEDPAQTPQGPLLSGSRSLISLPLSSFSAPPPHLPPASLPGPCEPSPPVPLLTEPGLPGGGHTRVWHLLVLSRTCLARSQKGPNST